MSGQRAVGPTTAPRQTTPAPPSTPKEGLKEPIKGYPELLLGLVLGVERMAGGMYC